MKIEVVFVGGRSWAWWLVVLGVKADGGRWLWVVARGKKQLP